MSFDANPALFRTRSFEANWGSFFAFLSDLANYLEYLPYEVRASTEENLPSLEVVFVAEANRWLSLGVSIGYFADTGRRFETRWEIESEVGAFFATDSTELSVDQFAAEVDLAWSHLSFDAIIFLLLLHFAGDDQWSRSIERVAALATGLERKPWWQPGEDLITEISWAFTEDEGPIGARGYPAAWRLGGFQRYVLGPDPRRVQSRAAELFNVQSRMVRVVFDVAEAEAVREVGLMTSIVASPLPEPWRDSGELWRRGTEA